jgi:hypothetical protein
VDLRKVPSVAPSHVIIQKDAKLLNAEDLDKTPLDLIFFDCHDYAAQFGLFNRLRQQGVLTDDTVLAFHDTNLHPTQTVPWAYSVEGGWVHQKVERRMVNELRQGGFDAFVLGTAMETHGPHLPFRHGLTIMRKFKPLKV